MKSLLLLSALLALGPSLATAVDGSPAIAMPADTRIVKFNYDSNNTYTILARPQAVTNIQLGQDEELVILALGDTVQWLTSNAPGHVFIKPLQPDLVTSATLVTSKRTYQLTLRSSPLDGQFYQQVSWETPQIITYHNQLTKVEGFARQASQKEEPVVTVSDAVALEEVQFNYTISGDAAFRPTHVFDDSRFTWVRMPPIQEMPALFMLNERNEAELLNYTIREPYFIIQRLVPGLLLKLGDDEVRVTRESIKKSDGSAPWWKFGVLP